MDSEKRMMIGLRAEYASLASIPCLWGKMLKRKPSKIEVKIEDKEELEEARRNNTTNTSNSNTSSNTGAAALLHQFDRAKDTSSKAHRIGISS
ncbi:hypothetical protein L6164_014272 [Bauhinia variegata]|uniref:Uncharacterized protein n=1 Tax=Bauhinia variegata TaxID=167791 RepID=A0ACB9NHP2_BAUVA|nr:hypothetical protein L6164_014272 [Bauhinia variegata]